MGLLRIRPARREPNDKIPSVSQSASKDEPDDEKRERRRETTDEGATEPADAAGGVRRRHRPTGDGRPAGDRYRADTTETERAGDAEKPPRRPVGEINHATPT